MEESVQHHGVRGALERNFGYAWAAGIVMAVAMVVLSVVGEVDIEDPDGFLMPNYVIFPMVVLIAIALDIFPRLVFRARGRFSTYRETLRTIMRERWPRSHWLFALGGVGAWYLTYATFRNLKSFVPSINPHLYDVQMRDIDKWLFLGHDPAVLLHDLLGTGVAAHFFSAVYFVWIGLVPVSIAIALVWTRSRTASSWYVTAVAFDWLLGAALYLVAPSLGPVYAPGQAGQFAGLPDTYNSQLVDQLLEDRVSVLNGGGTLQTIAAFPSLHTGITVTICLIVYYVGLARWIKLASLVFLALTIVGTIYLGWHYFVDILGGAAVGSVTVWAAAMATGNRVGLRPKLQRDNDKVEAADATVGAG